MISILVVQLEIWDGNENKNRKSNKGQIYYIINIKFLMGWKKKILNNLIS